MSGWKQSTGRGRTGTAAWKRRSRRIIRRDRGICYRCKRPGADDCDHIIPVAEGGSDSDDNLGAIHSWPCHAQKSAEEGARARWRKKERRDPERHPGLLGGD